MRDGDWAFVSAGPVMARRLLSPRQPRKDSPMLIVYLALGLTCFAGLYVFTQVLDRI
jgi:hypothetical protein